MSKVGCCPTMRGIVVEWGVIGWVVTGCVVTGWVEEAGNGVAACFVIDWVVIGLLFAIAFAVVEDGAVTVFVVTVFVATACVVIAEVAAVVRWVIKGCAKTRCIVGRREESL